MNKLFLYLSLLVLPVSAQQWRTGYYLQPAAGKLPISAIPFSKYTHVVQYALLPTYNSGSNTCGVDASSYTVSGNAAEFVSSAHSYGTKALVSMLHDSNSSAIQKCTDSSHINQFVSVIANYINQYGYDGFDIDWEAGIIDSQYQQWIISLRAALPGKVLTVATTWNQRNVLAQVQDRLDQINFMNYDSDVWPVDGSAVLNTAVYNAALYQGTNTNWITADIATYYNADSAGISRSKLGLGMPFYGRIKKGCLASYLSGSTCSQGITDPGQPYASGNAGSNGRDGINYSDLVNSVYWTNGTKVWDAAHGSQYIKYDVGDASQDAFVAYTGVEQIREAVNYVKTAQLGGIMTYELTNEYIGNQSGDARYPLSTAMYNALAGTSSTATAPSITTTSLPAATVGAAYSTTLSASGTTPMTWALASGSLPGGLTLNSSGVISGTPTTASTASFTVNASNSAGTNSKALSIVINANAVSATPPAITTGSTLPAATVGSSYSTNISASGTAPMAWDVVVGSLPSGLTIAASTGVITGTPTAAGTSTFTIQASNSAGSNSKTLSLTVNAAASTPPASTPPPSTPPPTTTNTAPTQSISTTNVVGMSATFNLAATDTGGYTTVQQASLMIVGNSGGVANGCYVEYWAPTRTLSLRSDDDTRWTSATLGSGSPLQNSQCTIDVRSATVSGSGNTLTVSYPVKFSKTFIGTRPLYTFTSDTAGLSSGWQSKGTWTVKYN